MRLSSQITVLGGVTLLSVGAANILVAAISQKADQEALLSAQLNRFAPIVTDHLSGQRRALEARVAGLVQDPTVGWLVGADLDPHSGQQAADQLRKAADAELLVVVDGAGDIRLASPPEAVLQPGNPLDVVDGRPFVVSGTLVEGHELLVAKRITADDLMRVREKSGLEVVLFSAAGPVLGTLPQHQYESVLSSSWEREEVPLTPRLRAVGGLPTAIAFGSYVATLRRLLATGVLSVLVVGGILWWMARRIAFPVDALAEEVGRMASGRLTSGVHADLERVAQRTQETAELATNLQALVEMLETVSSRLDRIGRGDLAGQIEGDGDLESALRRMVAGQRELVGQIVHTAQEIASVSSQMMDTAYALDEGASIQASVVEETQATMETLLMSANRVVHATNEVQRDAEQTHENHREVNKNLQRLVVQTDRIAEFLEVIRDIAAKAEMLALNAALEGTRAGRAGRGFSLVATEMQQLTESILDAVEDIKQLTHDIREATANTVKAAEEGVQRSESSAKSAKKIALIIHQQRSGTEQVTQSMEEISRVIAQSNAASSHGSTTSKRLADLSARLQNLVDHFEL